jgi:ribosomal protein S18 acetylase RimI-like enzyme
MAEPNFNEGSVDKPFGVVINAYLAKAAQIGRASEIVGPFTASVDPDSNSPFRNYAIPIEGATPQGYDVANLIQWFSERSRKPRLEYVSDAAPAVEPALLNAGFEVEGRLPLMTLRRGKSKHRSGIDGFELLCVTEEEALRSVAEAQNEAYGAGEVSEADVARLCRNVHRGGIVVAARELSSGRFVGAGLYTPPQDGVTEIAAIGTIPAYRRQGIAAAITAQLVESALSRNIELPFLMAAHSAEQGIYERIGFEVRASILHMSFPQASSG